MKKVRNYRVLRPVAWVTGATFLFLTAAPPAAAFQERPKPKGWKTQTPDADLQRKIREKEQRGATGTVHRPPSTVHNDAQPLSDTEMQGLWGRGQYRKPYFSGVLPWQRSLRDVNLCNGNLFKSFTDIQVSPARGAGLAWQRTYNSNDERVGPFGVGWTHAYDIRMEEADPNETANDGSTVGPDKVVRTDFFGGKHTYKRDADGLYSPPPYLFDEMDSTYLQFLADGPPPVLDDTQRGMDGTVKHFVKNGDAAERVCDYIEDRHGNRTTLTYGQALPADGGGTRYGLTRVTDPSGRYLDITWSDVDATAGVAWRITQVQGPVNPVTMAAVYTVSYEYNAEFNLWKVHQDPNGLNRITTYGYSTVSGESGLLSSISDPLGHTVSYGYSLPMSGNFTGTLWVTQITEPGSGGNQVWTLSPSIPGQQPWPLSCTATSNSGLTVYITMDYQLRKRFISTGGIYKFVTTYDSANNVATCLSGSSHIYGPDNYYQTAPSTESVFTYGPHGNVITQSLANVPNSTTTTSYYNASKYFQKESVTDPLGRVTTFDYWDKTASIGDRGEVKWVRDARYATTGEQFEYTYNQYGQELTETNLNNAVTQYTYGDAWGNLTQVVQDPGMGHLNRTTTMSYDVAGRVLSSTDAKSQSSSFTYNGVGQPLVATLPGETVTYTYGGNGRTASVQDGRGTTTIAYETGNDRVASVTDPVTGTVSYTYGLAGHRLTTTLPGGGTWTYVYDYAGIVGGAQNILPKDEPDSVTPMLRRVVDDQGRQVDYYSDTYGKLHRTRGNYSFDQYGNAASYLETKYSYGSGTGWTTQVQNQWLSKNMYGYWQTKVLVQNDYTYATTGSRLTNALSDWTGPLRTETYGYDELSRLTSVNYGDGQTQGYTFDPMGNRLTKTDNVTGNETYGYNAANMLTVRNGNAYTNDTNGNTLTGGGRANTWDGQNRLTQCVYNGTTTTHTYGSDGLRRRTVQGVSTTDYVLVKTSTQY